MYEHINEFSRYVCYLSPFKQKLLYIKYITGAAGAQWRRIRANSEMHLTVLSRVEDECGEFPSGIQSNSNQYGDRDWICKAREQNAAVMVVRI